MSIPATGSEPLRPLEAGERLEPAEFDARYEVTPGRAELVRGVVRLGSPHSFDHEEFASMVRLWLGTYAAARADVSASGSPTTHLPHGARVEPDALLRRLGPGAATHVVGSGAASRLHGAPELVVEVAISSFDWDFSDEEGKRAEYREAGVREYLLIAPARGEVRWFHLGYEPGRWMELPEGDGMIASKVFTGLKLDVQAMLKRDHARLLLALAPPPASGT